MIGYLECLRSRITTRLADAVSAAGFDSAMVCVRLVPKQKRQAHGVFTSNVVLLLAQESARLRRYDAVDVDATASPRSESQSATDIARALIEGLSLNDLPVERVKFAAPGFLNFYLTDDWRVDALRSILHETTSLDTAVAAIASTDAFRQLDFEIQYAYKRICNQLELLAGLGHQVNKLDDACLELLDKPQELQLMEHLAAATLDSTTQLLPYLTEVSALFHSFFNTSPIRGEAFEIAKARLALVQATKQIIECVLKELFPDS